MTVFAAVVCRDDEARIIDVAPVSAALADVYQTVPQTVALSRCVLLIAGRGAAVTRPHLDRSSGIAVVGQVLLEDSRSLRSELGQCADASDLALVAAAYERWGDECTRRTRGEFAFALWDSRRRLLVVARDGFGIRRAYVADGPRHIVVSNVLAAALNAPGISQDLDEEAAVEFLADGAPDDGRTMFRGIRCVAAGHTLRVDATMAPRLSRHWSFPRRRIGKPRREHEILEEYRHVLEAAVADRSGSGPVSILFSGGIDSTTIAAAARRANARLALHAFTAVYERLPSHNELRYASAAARRLEVALTTVRADTFEPLDHLQPSEPPSVMLLDEPTLKDWRLLLASASRHSPVALYGEDGDALFHPPGWRGLRGEATLTRLGTRVVRFAVEERRLPYLGIRLRERIGLTPPPRLGPPGFLSGHARRILATGTPPALLGRVAESMPAHPTRPSAQQRLLVGVARHLSPLIAAEAVAAPIELRLPLLDTRVIQFVMDTPAIPWCQRKYLPRRAYRGDLPDVVLTRPKEGVVGMDAVLLAGWRRYHPVLPTIGRASRVLTWIDAEEWRRALASDNVAEVGFAWRALQLDHWLTRLDEVRVARGASRCTA